MNWLIAILTTLTEVFRFGTKVIPPDEIRIEEHKEKEDLRKQDFSQTKVEDDFDYCKSRPEINIANYLKEAHPDNPVSDGYIQLITERVVAYRKDIVKRRGWRWRKHRDWLEVNGYSNNK